ncbi:mucin-binding protein [Lactiplantibacillus herbarum]|uniref:mucin-binding protein n=1 Tax=Lactiplantibacillus herbarum TaxID=1670446 RepID=UPI00064E6E32|nr:MBG domain-containing protein [Lactiplantibacillus herbarum]
MKNRLDRMASEGKTHYKLYKAGRNWVTAGITVFTVGAGLTFSLVDQAKAATNTSSSESDNSSSVSSSSTTATENTAVLKTTSAAATSASATAATSVATANSAASDSHSTAASNASSTGSTATSTATESTSTSASSAQSTAKSATSTTDSQSTQASSSAATSSSASSQTTSTDSTSSASGDTASTSTSTANSSSTPVTSTATSATPVKSSASLKSTMAKSAKMAAAATSTTTTDTDAKTTTTTITDSNGVTLTIINSYGKTMTYKTDSDVGAGSAGLRDLYTLLESTDNGIAEGDGLTTIYVQDSKGNYLTDNSGQRVNLLFLMTNDGVSDESLAANFTITYTNVAGTVSTDVSADTWTDLTDAGTYHLTITSAGIQSLTNLLADKESNFILPDGETVADFTPSFDSSADYSFQIQIVPATLGLVTSTTGINEIKVSSESQNYNGTISQSPKTISLFDGTSRSQPAITITNGIVTAVKSADGSSAKVGDVVFTSDDFSQIFTYTYTSNADNLTGADVGKYTISLSDTGLAKLQAYLGQNFIVSAAATTSNVPTLTINKATLTVNTASDEVTYNAKSHTTGVTVGTNYDGIVAGDYTTATGTNAGVYQITPTYTGTKAAIIARNYTLSSVAGTLTIDKAALTVSVKSVSGRYKKIYDSTTGTYPADAYLYGTTASVTTGTNYDGLTFSAVSEDDGVTTGYSNVGVYAMTGITSDDLSNYSVAYVDGTITITPMPITVRINTFTSTYNHTARTLTTDVVSGTNFDYMTFTATGADGSGNGSYTNAGTYLMTGTTVSDLSNYTVTYQDAYMIINPIVMTVTVAASEVTYDKQAHGTTVKSTGSNPDKMVFTAVAADGSGNTTYTNVGSYTMTATTDNVNSINYTITYVNADLVIDPAALTVTVNNQTLDYNGQTQGTTATLTSGTNYDNLTLSAVAKTDSSITGYKNAGSYAMTGLASGTGSTNYTITYVDGTLTINKAALTVTANDNTIIYDGQTHGTSTTVTKGTNYDNLTFDAVAKTDGTTTGYTNVGSYTMTGMTTDDTANYDITYVDGTLVINKAQLTVSVDDLTKVYDGNTYGTTATVTSGDDYDNLTFNVVAKSDNSTTGYKNVGSYTMVASANGTTAANYDINYVDGTITITPAALVVTVDKSAVTYDKTAHGTTVSVAGNDYDNLTFSATASDGSGNATYTNAGTYDMTGTTSDDTSNYTITYVDGTLTINKATLTVTVNDSKLTYDGQAHGTTTVTSGTNYDDLTFAAVAKTDGTTTSYTNVGSYGMTGTTTDDTSNYAITYKDGTLVIDKAALTVSVNASNQVYNGQNHGTTAGVTSGDDYDNLTFNVVAKSDNSTTGYKNVGSYTMVAVTNDAAAANYDISYVDGTLTITPAALTVTVNGSTIIYDGKAHGTDTTVTSGTNYDDLAFDAVAKSDGSTASYTNVGSYDMTGMTTDDTSNYTITYKDGTLVINKAQLTVAVDNLTQVYDGKTHGTTAKVTSGNDYDNLTFNVVAKSDNSTTGYKNVGNYTMVASANGTTAANYDINYVDGTIAITPAALTVTVNNNKVTYDSQEHGTTASVTSGDNYDNLAFTTIAKDGTATSYKNVGSYAMTGATADNADGNYTITYVDGTLAITPAALTVTVNNPSVTYDGQEHSTTASVTDGTNYDNLTFTTAAADGTTSYRNVGEYVMTGTTADNVNNNYTITYVDGTLAITPAALTVTVNNNTAVYDSKTHGTTTTVTDGTDYDNLVFTTVAKSDGTTMSYKNVGSYAMTGQTASADASNYDITYVDGTLAITPAKLTVTVNKDSVTYDAKNHGLTAGVTSGTNYDNLTFNTVGTDGVTTSYKNAGSYTMTGTTTDNTNNNYDISYVDNTLTITPAALTVTVNKDSTVYDAKDHSLTAGVTAGTNYDNLMFTTVGTDGTTTSYKNVGNYVMTGTTTGNTAGNYTISYVDGTLAITPAALTVTVNKNAATYDGQAHGTTASVTDGDNYDGLSFTTVAKGGTATSYTNVGTYTMTGTTTGNANGNYNISYVDGDLVIAPAVLTITVNNNQVTYDGKTHGATVTVAGDNYDNLTFAAVAKDGSGSTYTNAGTYAMTSAVTGDVANYTIKTVDGQLIINKAAATINVAGKTYWYDGTKHDLTASVTGMVNGETLNYTLTDGASAVGTKAITAQVTADDVAQNYDVTVNDGTLTVGDVTVTYIYQYMGADGKLHTASTNSTTASHGTDATASDYLSYTSAPQAKTGYSLVSNNSDLAANGTLAGVGGNVVYTYQANTEKATVTYVDQTTGKTLTTADLTGAYGTTDSYTTADKIAAYEKLGYQLVDSDFPTTGVSYDQDGVTKSYTVNLVHRMLEVTVTTPGKPGEPIDTDNPNGPKYPSGTATTDLTATSHRTISYVDVNGKTMQPSVDQSVTYQRTAMIDVVTGVVTYADWTTDQADYQQVDSPVVTGYTADQTSVGKATTAAGDSDTSVKVVYTANTEHATITYVDQTTGKTLTTDQLSGQYGTTTTDTSAAAIAKYEKQGYELVGSDVPAAGIVYDQDGVVKQYTVTLKHRVTTATPSHPGTPGQPINADNPDGPKYPNGTGATDLTATSHRTINYVDANGKTMKPSVVQTVTYHRTATIDVVTGEVTYSKWTTDQADYQQVVSPTIKGYQADQTQVDGETVTVGTADTSVNVVYTANTEHATVSYVDQTTGKLLTMVDLTGAYGTNDAYTTAAAIAEYKKAGYVLSSSDFPTSGVVYDEDGTVKNYTVRLTHASSATTETKTIKQTIHYQDNKGNALQDDTDRTITFTRTKNVDQVTGETTYSGWSTTQTASFDAMTAPEIAKYHADTTGTQAVTVSADSLDDEQTIVYTLDDDNGSNGETPTDPKEPTEVVESPDQINPGSEQSETEASVTNKKQQSSVVKKNAATVTTNENHVQPLTDHSTNQQAESKQATLPQTGDDRQASIAAELLGLTAATLLAGLGMILRKRHE